MCKLSVIYQIYYNCIVIQMLIHYSIISVLKHWYCVKSVPLSKFQIHRTLNIKHVHFNFIVIRFEIWRNLNQMGSEFWHYNVYIQSNFQSFTSMFKSRLFNRLIRLKTFNSLLNTTSLTNLFIYLGKKKANWYRKYLKFNLNLVVKHCS